ncbi:MAG TPA: hypothetical protein VGJ95_15790 [Pseudonocardiaceae bacterium]
MATINPPAGERRAVLTFLAVLCAGGLFLPAWIGWSFDAVLAGVIAAGLVRSGWHPVRQRGWHVRRRAVRWPQRVPVAAAWEESAA